MEDTSGHRRLTRLEVKAYIDQDGVTSKVGLGYLFRFILSIGLVYVP